MFIQEHIFVCIVVIIIMWIIMNIVDDALHIIIQNASIMKNQATTIAELNKKIDMLEKTVNHNWTFLSEEVSDIYPAIKSINVELMLIKTKYN